MISLDDLKAAQKRIEGHVHRTPVLTSSYLNHHFGKDLYFKCENFQKIGAFKFRGGINAVLQLTDEEANRGVATHSSGNHAQALALAARNRGIKANIVMPENAPKIKINAVKDYGAEITLCKNTSEDRINTLNDVIAETGATLVHPFNDERIIAGQSTCALEFLEEVDSLDAIITPVGGGGLLSGTLLATKLQDKNKYVFAAEPKGADDAWRSMQSGKIEPSIEPKTICDGLLTSLGDKTFPIIHSYVDDIKTVSDEAIIAAMRLVWERMKIIIEPSSATVLALLMEHQLPDHIRQIGLIISGGNVDVEKLPF